MSDTDPILAAAERFGAVHVVVVGSMNVDQITYCRRVPDEGETLVADRYEQGFGGKGANQAVMAGAPRCPGVVRRDAWATTRWARRPSPT